MRTRASIAVALFSALGLVAGCGGSDDGDLDLGGPTSAPPTTPAEPTPTGESDQSAPEVNFPSDFEVVFEGATPDDPVKAAILRDNELFIKSWYLAITEGDPKHPLARKYGDRDALVGTYEFAKWFVDQGHTVTGTLVIRDRKVTVRSATEAAMAWCEDQTNTFRKVRDTGEVIKTTPSSEDKGYFEAVMTLRDGVWVTMEDRSRPGDKRCL